MIALLLAGAAEAAQVSGVVFHDRNGNGRREADEPGVAGVAVSNGTEVVVTDAQGRYALAAAGTDERVFVVKPRGWALPETPDHRPVFYGSVKGGAGPEFALREHAEPEAFRMLVLTDTQVGREAEVDFLHRLIVDRAAEQPTALAVALGDMVNDRHDLYASLNATLGRLGMTWLPLCGNHDLDPAPAPGEGAMTGFEAVYGPATYAFHYGPVLFVALNDVRHLDRRRYVGGLTEEQFAFIENVLRTVPREQMVVLMMHIPWFYPSPAQAQTFREADRRRLFALFKDRPHNFWLSGHTHYQRHVFYGPSDGWTGAAPLHEYNVAAACGGFWGGPADEHGIPASTMWDGTPPGFAVVTFDGTKEPVTDYYAGRGGLERQIGLHAPKATRTGQAYVSYWANVFNGHDGWTIESRVDGRPWAPMRRVIEWDPTYAQAFLEQDERAEPVPYTRLPDPTVCYHLWRAYFPADLAPGEHAIEVRATDPQGKVFTATRTFVVAPDRELPTLAP